MRLTTRLACLGGALLALTLAGVATGDAAWFDQDAELHKTVFVSLGGAAALVYGATVRLSLRAPPERAALWIVLATAVLLRLVTLAAPPFLSGDLYRYIWDGRVQLAGVNPYAHLPNDPALADLRDESIWPNINRGDYAPTIYPPAAQLVFRAVAALGQTPLAMKIAMLGFDLLAIVAMLRLLAMAGMSPLRVAIYAWNPVPVWEFAGNGHIDAAGLGLLAVAVLAAVTRRRALSGVLLGLAALTKFLPLAAFPALWRPPDWRMPAALLATIVALYALYADVGWAVFGFLRGYAREEGIAGSGIWWLDVLGQAVTLPPQAGRIWLAGALVCLLGLALRIAATPPAGIRQTGAALAVLATATILAITPHYTWYFAWLAWPCCLAPFASVIWLSVAPLVMYHDPFRSRTLHFALIYAPFLLLAAHDLRRARKAGDAVASTTVLRRS